MKIKGQSVVMTSGQYSDSRNVRDRRQHISSVEVGALFGDCMPIGTLGFHGVCSYLQFSLGCEHVEQQAGSSPTLKQYANTGFT